MGQTASPRGGGGGVCCPRCRSWGVGGGKSRRISVRLGWRSAEMLRWAAVVPGVLRTPQNPWLRGIGRGWKPPTQPAGLWGGGGTALPSRLLPSNGGGSAGRSRPGGARGRRSRGDAGPGCGWMGLRGLLALLRAAAPSAGDEVGSHLLPPPPPRSPPSVPLQIPAIPEARLHPGCRLPPRLGLRGQSGDNAGDLRAAPGLRGAPIGSSPSPFCAQRVGGGSGGGGSVGSQRLSIAPPPPPMPALTPIRISAPPQRTPKPALIVLTLQSSPLGPPPCTPPCIPTCPRCGGGGGSSHWGP